MPVEDSNNRDLMQLRTFIRCHCILFILGFQKATCAWSSKMNARDCLGNEDASHSRGLFVKTSGLANGPLKEDWGRQLRKQLRNVFDFGTKLFFGFFCPISIFIAQINLLYNLNLNFRTGPKLGRLWQTFQPSRENREGWNVCNTVPYLSALPYLCFLNTPFRSFKFC